MHPQILRTWSWGRQALAIRTYGKFFRPSRAANSIVSGPIWPKFEFVRDFMHVLVTSLPASIKRIGSKTTKKRWRHRFPHFTSMGAFCCYENQHFDPICPKTLCNLSPTLMMLHIKFDQHWPTGLRDIQVSSELWQNEGMTEPQNSGRTRQIQYSPRFFKAGL